MVEKNQYPTFSRQSNAKAIQVAKERQWQLKAGTVVENAINWVRDWNKHIDSETKRGEGLTPGQQEKINEVAGIPSYYGNMPFFRKDRTKFAEEPDENYIAKVTSYPNPDSNTEETSYIDSTLMINMAKYRDEETGLLRDDEEIWGRLFSDVVHEGVHIAGGSRFQGSADYKKISSMMSEDAIELQSKRLAGIDMSQKELDEKKKYASGRTLTGNYFNEISDPTEVHARIMELRYALGWKDFGDINLQKQLIPDDIYIPENTKQRQAYKDLIDVIGEDNIRKGLIEVSEIERPTSPENEFMEWARRGNQSIFEEKV